MSVNATAERIAAAINRLSTDVASARTVLTDRALVSLIALESGVSQKTIARVLGAMQRLPEKMLTPHGRAIRVRDE